ncbi:MAG: hypothetical protein E7602_03935 [Ruminococcaceae bacterium]|nr:hypothetical protein [Oscillospiraceae bacterium]
MKTVQLIAYTNRIGFSLEDLKDYNEIFYSPVESFDNGASDDFVLEQMCEKYKTEIDKLYNPKIKIKFL